MKRRSFFRTLLAVLTAPFVTKIGPPDQFSVDIDWSQIPAPEFGLAWMHPSHPTYQRIRKQYLSGRLADVNGLDWYVDQNIKPFAELPTGPITAMETVKSNTGEELIAVVSGGVGYLVDKHGKVTT